MSEGADWIMFRNMIKLIVLDTIQWAPSDKHIIKSDLITFFSINSFGRLVIKMEEYLERFDLSMIWYYDLMLYDLIHTIPFSETKRNNNGTVGIERLFLLTLNFDEALINQSQIEFRHFLCS